MSSLTKRIAAGAMKQKNMAGKSLKQRPWIKFAPNPARPARVTRLAGHQAKMRAKRAGRWGWRKVKRGRRVVGIQHRRNWA